MLQAVREHRDAGMVPGSRVRDVHVMPGERAFDDSHALPTISPHPLHSELLIITPVAAESDESIPPPVQETAALTLRGASPQCRAGGLWHRAGSYRQPDARGLAAL